MNSLLLTDGYKTGHHQQYPRGTQYVYSNFTPRSNRHAPKGIDKVVSFGQQYVIQWIANHFQENFFSKDEDQVCGEMKEVLSSYLGCDYDVSHFRKLHQLGYLPIEVKSLKEGIEVPMKVPVLTIVNTTPEMYWVTNYLETIISTMLWKPMTSASLALNYKRILTRWANKTDAENLSSVDFQAHDFSMRGMSGLDTLISSAMAHAIVFSGGDSLPAIHGLKEFYDARGFIIGSVNATEHSVMCAGTKDDEIGTFRRLLQIYPTGILSVVSDTWDLWRVLTDYLPKLKEEIVSRNGKLVIRPDSGDPVDIICGTGLMASNHPEHEGSWSGVEKLPSEKGLIELLWETFGGLVNEQGYKVLHSSIGAIYGDAITPERAESICKKLAAKGFASTNIVFGIGSFTYQYNTRDTFGFAMKATHCIVNGEPRNIFKEPITDDGTKKSAKGLLHVTKELKLIDECSIEMEGRGALQTIFKDGSFTNLANFNEIKQRINDSI